MTTTAPPAGDRRAGSRLARALASVALLLAFAAAVLLALGPLGWRAGWWHYRVGLQILMPWALYCGLAAVGVGLIALAFGRRNGGSIVTALLAFALGAGVAYMPWHYNEMRGTFAPINDITTDWQNVPQFQAALPLRAAEGANPATYGGDKTSEQQRRFYPDIGPVMLEMDPRKAFARAHDAARRMGWTIVASDAEAGRIEAYERSRWFGFADDVVIRVMAFGNGSRVDIRSMSRFGRGDFGVNARRVRAYLKTLRETAGQ